VQQVLYTLHAPAGTQVWSVIRTSGIMGPKETVRFFADAAANTYTSTTLVTTQTAGSAVRVDMTAASIVGRPATSAIGTAGEIIPLRIGL